MSHEERPAEELATRPFAALDDDEHDAVEREQEAEAGAVAAPLMAGMTGGTPGGLTGGAGTTTEPAQDRDTP